MRFAFVLPFVALAACSEAETPDGPVQSDAQAVLMVEDANDVIPPLVPVVPEAILDTDVAAHDMDGAACHYAVGTDQGPQVIASETDAFIKLDGEIIRFASDPGSRELPFGSRSRYSGREYSLQVEVIGQGNQTGYEVVEYEGTVSVRDRYERVIYRGSGPAQCGA
jgi:hypothetical protein